MKSPEVMGTPMMVSRNIGIISSTELQRNMKTADEAMELEEEDE